MANLFPEEEIESLRRELERHNRLYYVDAKLEIPDREYDALMTKLMRWRLLIRNFIRRAAPA